MRKVVTFLWLQDRAEEAAEFCVSLLDDARIISKTYITDPVAELAGGCVPSCGVGMIEVKPGRQEFGAALAKAGSSPWAEAAAERRQEGAPGFYMGR